MAGMHSSRRRPDQRATAAVAVVMLGALAVVAAQPGPAEGAAGDPVPPAPVTVWGERFDELDLTHPLPISSANGDAENYKVDPLWVPGLGLATAESANPTYSNTTGQCNGWMLRSNSTQPGAYDLLKSTDLSWQQKYDLVQIAIPGATAAIWTAIVNADPEALRTMTDAAFTAATGASAAQRTNLQDHITLMLNCADPAWSSLRLLADGLGTMQGLPKGTNAVLSSYTNGPPGAGHANDHLQFEATEVATTRAGHYYAATAWLAAMNPDHDSNPSLGVWPTNASTTNANNRQDPQQVVSLLVGGQPVWWNNTPLNVFSMAAAGNPAVWRIASSDGTMSPIWGGSLLLMSTALNPEDVYRATADGVPLGVRLENLSTGNMGNDAAFDNPEILDVTPSLAKAFVPAQVEAQQTSTLVITVTNTSELLSKKAWQLTDTLATGLRVADDPNVVSTCDPTTLTWSAEPGSGVVTAQGDLRMGESWCTVSVDVVADYAGVYENGRDNLETIGLWEPCESRDPAADGATVDGCEPATLTVTTDPAATKAVDESASVSSAGDAGGYLAYTLTVGLPKATDLASFVVADPFAGLAPVADPAIAVRLGDRVLADTAYATSYTEAGLTVTFTNTAAAGAPSSLQYLSEAALAGTPLVVTFRAASTVLDGAVVNQATVTTSATGVTVAPYQTNPVDTHFGGLDVVKTDGGVLTQPLAGAQFAVYATEADAAAAAASGTVTAAAVLVDTDGDGAGEATFTSGDDGALHLAGLRYVPAGHVDADGDNPNPTYYLVELAAPDGYRRLTEPIPFTLTGPADGTVDLNVPNCLPAEQPWDSDGDGYLDACVFAMAMPHTGSGPQFPYVVAGLTVLLAGAAGVLAWRSPQARAAVTRTAARFRPTGGGAR